MKFNRGTKAKVNSSAISDGSLNLATDDGTLYADVSSTKRIELNPQSDWSITDTSSKGYIKNKPDLSSYATQSELSYYASKSEIPSVPVKGIKVTGSTSSLSPDISGVVTIPNIPTNVSSFTNDKGYLTSHQDLSEYQKKLTFDNTPTTNSSNPVTSAGIKVYVDGKIPTKVSQLNNDAGYGKYTKYAVTVTASSVISSTTHVSDGFGYSYSIGYTGCTSDWYADIVFPSTFKDPYWLETGTNTITIYFINKPSSDLSCTLVLIHG